MSDSGYVALRQLKLRRSRDMAKNYCHRFVQDVMKKYDTENSGILLVKRLQNQCSKHKPACIEHFNQKYIAIVEQILDGYHPTGYVDKMQLFQECKLIYNRMKNQQAINLNTARFL